MYAEDACPPALRPTYERVWEYPSNAQTRQTTKTNTRIILTILTAKLLCYLLLKRRYAKEAVTFSGTVGVI